LVFLFITWRWLQEEVHEVMKKFEDLFSTFQGIKVGIIGDVMLDTYMWGHVERISPEAPVPVVLLDKRELRLGGAGNVALNVQSLGAPVFVVSVVGKDEDAGQLMELFQQQGINNNYILKSRNRITTNKTRIISRNQQMMRLDAELITDLQGDEEQELIKLFQSFITEHKPHMVILQDYNKGVLTPAVIEAVIRICKEAGVLTAVDPKRKNFFDYKGVDLFKPNLKEVKDALNLMSANIEQKALEAIHRELHRRLQHHISFITLSERGVFYQNETAAALIPSHLRNIADVSGAGDTVIAVAALVYAATKDIALMAEIANIAGGLVCEEVGTAAIDRAKLLRECNSLLS
jgi:rfaE bifunctional protein kinase chain/domain